MKKSVMRFMSFVMTVMMCVSLLALSASAEGEAIGFVSPSRNDMVFAQGYELWPTVKVTSLGGGIDEIVVTLSGPGIVGSVELGTLGGTLAEYVEATATTYEINGYQLARLQNFSADGKPAVNTARLTSGTGKYLLNKSGEYTITAQAKAGGTNVGTPVERTFTVQKYAKNTPWTMDWEDYEAVETYDSLSPLLRSAKFRNTFVNINTGGAYVWPSFTQTQTYVKNILDSSAITAGINEETSKPYYGQDPADAFDLGDYVLSFTKDADNQAAAYERYYTFSSRTDENAERIYGTNTTWNPIQNQFIAPGQKLVFEGDLYAGDYDQKITPLVISQNGPTSGGSEGDKKYGITQLIAFGDNNNSTNRFTNFIQVGVPKTGDSGEIQRVVGYFAGEWYHWRYELDTVNRVADVYVTGRVYFNSDATRTYNPDTDTLYTGTTRILAQKEFNWADEGTSYIPSFDTAGIKRVSFNIQNRANSGAHTAYLDNFAISYMSEDDSPDLEFEITGASVTPDEDEEGVTGIININNPTLGATTALLALYDGDRLVGVELSDVIQNNGDGTGTMTISADRDASKAYTKAKLFAWNGAALSSITPMVTNYLPCDTTLGWTAEIID